MRAFWTLLAALLFVAPSSSLAVEIIPVAQDRSLVEEHFDPQGGRTVTTETATDFQPFAADFGALAAHHFSTIGTDVITGDLYGNGRASLDGVDEETYDVEADFLVDFDLTEPASYVLDAVMDLDSHNLNARSIGRVTFSVFDAGLGSFTPLTAWIFDADYLPPPLLSDSGLLAPGTYRLEALAIAEGYIDGSPAAHRSETDVDFTLTLSNVPEPSTGWMVWMGVAAVLRRRARAEAHGSEISSPRRRLPRSPGPCPRSPSRRRPSRSRR